jgi:copper oxidase (laccase) domain-containing protein
MAGSRHPLEDQARNRGTLARALGFDGVARVKQVHGRDVVRVDGAGAAPAEPWPTADAMWSDRPGVLLGVAAADCVPVLVADPGGADRRAHAGWQGTTLRVAEALVEAMVAGGAVRERLVASLGPAIGPCCYVIDMERATVVNERIGEGCLRKIGERIVMDLWAANTAQLRSVGRDSHRDVRRLHALRAARICGRTAAAMRTACTARSSVHREGGREPPLRRRRAPRGLPR